MQSFSQFLEKWALEVVGKNVAVTNDFVTVTDKPQVIIFLREFTSVAPSHQYTNKHLELGVRYLVCADGVKSVSESNQLLQSLIFSAMEHKEINVDLSPPPPEFWLSLGIKARPCFNVIAKEIKERTIEKVPAVTEPIVVNAATRALLYGTVKSPNNLPITGAQVKIPSDNISVTTDNAGRFQFGALMPEPDKKKIVIRHKQYWIEQTVSISKSPVEIIFKL